MTIENDRMKMWKRKKEKEEEGSGRGDCGCEVGGRDVVTPISREKF